ncbi:MAG: folylpolyglutamate synthase/dihydrofolate synthase family protein [Vampirovibrionales bacterium]|nr:folylpolyglutamate synthase/dihydrofolate synthase family protein [Vampirovibrionales bacterium]
MRVKDHYTENIAFLDRLGASIQKLGLERMRDILQTLGNPQDTLPMVHITGTNGKGSVTAILESILCSAGFRVGMYTSPHLIDVRERIRLNGRNIPKADFSDAISHLRQHLEMLGVSNEDYPTYFEWLNILAYPYFVAQKADITLFEVGLGGRLDSTNIVKKPEVTVITGIGLDHAHILGDTPEKIAAEKAGILKPGVPLVLGPALATATSVKAVITEKANALGVPIYQSSSGTLHLIPGTSLEEGLKISDTLTGEHYLLSLRAPYQLENLASALEVVKILRQQGWNISESAIKKGLQSVHWPARFQVFPKDRLIIDGSHNAQGFESLRAAIEFYLGDKQDQKRAKKIYWLASLQKNRPLAPLQKMIMSCPQTQGVIWTTAKDGSRFHSPQEAIQEAISQAKKLGITCQLEAQADVSVAIEQLMTQLSANPDAYGVVTGSLYTAGDILALLGQNDTAS